MVKKFMSWKTKGMNRDLSVSAFNPEFSFENRNLRLSTSEGNTQLSWVNEKGTKEEKVRIYCPFKRGDVIIGIFDYIPGTPIGVAVINHQLVLFTHSDEAPKDFIIVLKYYGDDDENVQVDGIHYRGRGIFAGNLNFSVEHPLETLVSYEAEHIQKVYWTDGVDQPRVINIANEEQIERWYGKRYSDSVAHHFDFVPEFKQPSSFTVEKEATAGGTFAPGVIQYLFTYVNKYGQESNIVRVSSLEYIIRPDRGLREDEKVSCSFKLAVDDVDKDFDYIRFYSIQRTSINAEPMAKRLIDLYIGNNTTIQFTDNGEAGNSIDPQSLLFIGGKEITALTMAEKDGTLFMGNIEEKNVDVSEIQAYFKTHRQEVEFSDLQGKFNQYATGLYTYVNQSYKGSLDSITHYKGGETYRLGFQLQKKTGEWTEPIYIGDYKNEHYPTTNVQGGSSSAYVDFLPVPFTEINLSAAGIDTSVYSAIRPVVVFPSSSQRSVVAQGVLNPTVFNVMDRLNNTPFAQASWYFRPYCSNIETKSGYTIDADPRKISVEDLGTIHGYAGDFKEYNSYFIGKVKPVYVLTGVVKSQTERDTILRRGSLDVYRVDLNTRKSTIQEPFVGAIHIQADTYAFVRYTPWPADLQVTGEKVYLYNEFSYPELSNMYTDTQSYDMYEGMQVDANHMYYYAQFDESMYEKFIFTFMFEDIMVCKVTFESQNKGSVPENLTINTLIGKDVECRHYQSLYTQQDGGRNMENMKLVEIQGSSKLYDNPFALSYRRFGKSRNKDIEGESSTTAPFNNTQFFVDQSIVTLNSPDLEFDTEVQTTNTDHLKLRIVGVIPLTASASSHSITATEKLPTNNSNTSDNVSHLFGGGESERNIYYANPRSLMSDYTTSSGKRLVSDFLWNDVIVGSPKDKEDPVETTETTYDFLVYPWQRSGALNNDTRKQGEANSWLTKKKMSNILYSANTEYLQGWIEDELGGESTWGMQGMDFDNISAEIVLTENNHVQNYRLPKQFPSAKFAPNYYANIDKVLYNEEGYESLTSTLEEAGISKKTLTSPISMKYKSTSHFVVSLQSNSNTVFILPKATGIDKGIYPQPEGNQTYWGDNVSFTQEDIDLSSYKSRYANFLWLGELYRDIENPFGGDSLDELRNNNWQVAGRPMPLDSTAPVQLIWYEGDTYYQRYDCLKTYAYTPEDTNQLVEILSFMCETHVNLDGRYDRNRGQIVNYNMSPENFNLLNPVYSQRNNFFIYKKLGNDGTESFKYPNQFTWSLRKTEGSLVDPYTSVSLATSMSLDGDKGEIQSLQNFNDQLIAFQDKGIAQILYNENVQISSQQGVPIEIANSEKVQGKRYLSDTIGCSNKWSIVHSPGGLYFMDSIGKGIFRFNGQLDSISLSGGFDSWCKQNIPAPDVKWNPVDFDNFVGYYDMKNEEVLYVGKDEALAYSEKFGCFTSFYDYGSAPYFASLDDHDLWVSKDLTDEHQDYKLWSHHGGSYCRFFGKPAGYSMTLVGNPEPQLDKTFTNLELRAIVEEDGGRDGKDFIPSLPFDHLEVWNEYQHGITELSHQKPSLATKHHQGTTSALQRKFRIWRCDIPRDNYELPEGGDIDEKRGIYRYYRKPLDRMRNPWLYLKLTQEATSDEIGITDLSKTEIHDITMSYLV